MEGAKLRRVLAHAGALVSFCLLAGGCLTRPVTSSAPTTKEYWQTVQRQGAIDKVDLLFMIDNSASMGDKQELLAKAVPDLLKRLLVPFCVREDDGSVVDRNAQNACPTGSKEEFEPVHDMHIGIVSSSLGGGGADTCLANARNDDRAHLLTRSKTGTVTDSAPAGFLAWMPDVAKNDGKPEPPVTRLKQLPQLESDFAGLVTGVQEDGCGLEAQMESWYRFLVQPDPWNTITFDRTTTTVSLEGIDGEILAQRRDFLRPDSLLAVIVVTDEEDSWSDPLWMGGKGWVTRANDNSFAENGVRVTDGRLPRATSACKDPNDPKCTWCGFSGVNDPNCASLYTSKQDALNVRYTDDMKRRYGMNPQFPISRYVNGLKNALVPNRAGEHFTPDGNKTSLYVGRNGCRNPIYAKNLPTNPNAELCNLEAGPRTSELVFFAVIGGVPWDLLTDRNDPKAPFKTTLDPQDWRRILGADPSKYDQTGIDPRMIESIAPRNVPGDWDTTTSKAGLDLQYACTFDLPQAKDCSVSGANCDCGSRNNAYSQSPLCAPNPKDGNNPTLQTRGKAYPTIREFRVAKEMGENGVVASLCPRTLDETNADYGYRPAMRAIVERLKNVLGGQCVPQPLTRGADGRVPCLLLSEVPTSNDQATACDPKLGLTQPDPEVLARFNADRLKKAQNEAAGSARTVSEKDLVPVCELAQMAPDGSMPITYSGKPTCDNNGMNGWCYVDGRAAGKCTGGAIKFGVAPPGITTIQCIQQTSN